MPHFIHYPVSAWIALKLHFVPNLGRNDGQSNNQIRVHLRLISGLVGSRHGGQQDYFVSK